MPDLKICGTLFSCFFQFYKYVPVGSASNHDTLALSCLRSVSSFSSRDAIAGCCNFVQVLFHVHILRGSSVDWQREKPQAFHFIGGQILSIVSRFRRIDAVCYTRRLWFRWIEQELSICRSCLDCLSVQVLRTV